MAVAGQPRAMVVGDDGAERRRIAAWFPAAWLVMDGGPPAAATARAVREDFVAVAYTAATDSVDLGTWHQALALSGFRGVVIDTRPGMGAPEGVRRATDPSELAAALSLAG